MALSAQNVANRGDPGGPDGAFRILQCQCSANLPPIFLGKPTTERIQAWLLNSRLAGGVQGRRLTDRSIRVIIRQRARAAGVEGRVSGHSLRVGSAQSLANAGASLVEMQVAGRWRSPAMLGRYAQGQLAKQGAVARLRYGDEFDLVQRGAKRSRRRSRVNSLPHPS